MDDEPGMSSFKRKQTAFTLIELLVVISIITMLMAVMMPALAGARKAARQTKWLAFVKQYQVDPNLVLMYPMQDGTGEALENWAVNPQDYRHYEPTEYRGRLTGGATWATGRWPGKTGVFFNGFASGVDIGHPVIYNPDSSRPGLTILATFKVEQFTANRGRIFNKVAGNGNGNGPPSIPGNPGVPGNPDFFGNGHLVIALGHSGNALQVQVRLADHLYNLEGGIIEQDTWTHAAATYDGQDLRLYINGELIALTSVNGGGNNGNGPPSIPGNPGVPGDPDFPGHNGGHDATGAPLEFNETAPAAIGNTPSTLRDRPFHGVIDEVIVFNRALTAEEIAAHFDVARE